MRQIVIGLIVILLTVQLQVYCFERKVDLKVYKPQELQKVFTKYNNQIPNFLTPYGIIPWGKQLKGQLDKANPIDACTRLAYDPNQNRYQRPFLLIEMSKNDKCSLDARIYNAQNHGAQLVILIQKDKDSQLSVDKYLDKMKFVSIPVILVENEIGQSLIQFYNDSTILDRPTLIASFPTQEETQNYLALYTDINTLDTYRIFDAISQYNEFKENKYSIKIFYNIPERIVDDTDADDTSEEAEERRKKIKEQQEQLCFGDGQYCDKDNPTTLKEIVRQTCIYKYYPTLFFEYIHNMHNSFKVYLQRSLLDMYDNGDQEYFDFDKENIKAWQDVNAIDTLIPYCYESSFISGQDEKKKELPRYKQDNYLLAYHHNEFESLTYQSQLPFVILNQKEIPSSSKNYTADVLKSLCEADDDIESKICSNLFQIKKNNNKGLNTGEIVLIVMGSLAASVLLCYFAARQYYKFQKRRYSNELERVDTIVNAFIELNNNDHEKQTNNNNNDSNNNSSL